MQKPLRALRREHRKKKLIIFDLDGTLAESKLPMDASMSALLVGLLKKKRVAVIGGGKYGQFQRQFLKSLRSPAPLLKNLYLFPTCSTAFYRYTRGWKNVYTHKLSRAERKQILSAFGEMFRDIGYAHPKRIYGVVLEDRETQITFSALGQKAPVHVKEK